MLNCRVQHLTIQKGLAADEPDGRALARNNSLEELVDRCQCNFLGHQDRMLAESSFIRIAVGAGKIAGLCDVERDRVGRNKRDVSRRRGCKRRTEIQQLLGAFPILA